MKEDALQFPIELFPKVFHGIARKSRRGEDTVNGIRDAAPESVHADGGLTAAHHCRTPDGEAFRYPHVPSLGAKGMDRVASNAVHGSTNSKSR